MTPTSAGDVISMSIGASGAAVIELHPLMSWTAVVCGVGAIILLLWFLVRKPDLTAQVKLLLLFGFGVLPAGASLMGNVASFEHTKTRPFCGSCHVMGPFRADAEDPLSESLAARHARNEEFGPDNCYECHRDYGAFSTVMTKLGGMRHVYEYYTHYYKVSTEDGLREIALYKPFSNASCIRCHSTRGSSWLHVSDHQASLELVRSGDVSCVGLGCHGPVHPFGKAGLDARAERQEAGASEPSRGAEPR